MNSTTDDPLTADDHDEAEVQAHNAGVRHKRSMGYLLCLAVGLITAGMAGYILGGLVATIGMVLVSAIMPPLRLTMAEHHAAAERAQRGLAPAHTGRNLVAVGVLLIFLALVGAFLALRADTTVATSIASDARHVINAGLMFDQSLMLMISGFLGLGGLMLIGFGCTAKR